jgi:hypothetical protein
MRHLIDLLRNLIYLLKSPFFRAFDPLLHHLLIKYISQQRIKSSKKSSIFSGKAGANCKTPRPSKIALFGHFAAPPPSSTLSSMSLAAEFGSRCDPDKLAQNHRFFWDGEFCNWLAGYARGLIFILTMLVPFFSQLHAQIILEEVMSKEDQKKTGIANLSRHQKIALEAWLNQNFILKTKEHSSQSELSLSLNINNGQKIELSDNSLWEIAPNDVSISAVWITPFPVKITPSGDPDYPCLIVNLNSGVSIKARQIPPSATPPAQNTP